LIILLKNNKKNRKEGKEEISNLDILKEVYTMIIAGSDTTSKTIEYGLLLLAKYPNIQQQIYDELIINNNNNILNVIHQLHIFRAFIYELLRLSHVAPLGMPHMTGDKDIEIELNGHQYILPKRTVVLGNIQSANLSNETWDNNNNNNTKTTELNLLNWLNNENKFKMNNNLMTFGTGKRNCVGQSIAIRTLYIVFSLIIIHYKIISPNNNINFEIKRKMGVTYKIDPPIGLNLQYRNL
jgi:cytochrome P450